MARQTLVAVNTPGHLDYDGANLPFTACNPTDKERTLLSQREILVVKNVSVDTARLFTVSSVADVNGRTKDQTFSIPFGQTRIFGPFPLNGWKQTGSFLHFEGADDDLMVAVIRIT